MNKTTTETFINKAKKIHGEKYDYSLLNYINSNIKVKIICLIHGEFYQYPGHHINRKYGCPKCSNRHNYNTIEFIEKSKEIHNNKYNYSLTKYINNRIKVKIICDEHGIFEQIPRDHINKHGCPSCVGLKKLNNHEFIKKSKEIHNCKYDYSLVNYINQKNKIKIICSKHGIFEQIPNDHLNGSGCPNCKISKGEDKIKKFLQQNNIIFEQQKKFNDCKNKYKLPFDFYIPSLNICIEFDGSHHFEIKKQWNGEEGFKKVKINDNIKNDFCKKNNINLLRISYIENIEEKLKKLLTTN